MKFETFVRPVRLPYLCGIVILLVLGGRPVIAQSKPSQYWQLVLQYDAQGVVLVEAQPIEPMEKAPKTPGLTAAPLRLPYSMRWSDGAGGTLFQTGVELPLGQRVAIDTDQACERTIPGEGVLVLRVRGPDPVTNPAQIRLQRTEEPALATVINDLPTRAFDSTELSFSLDAATLRAQVPPPGPKTVTKIRNTGPDSNRLVVVVLGDGYTAANLTAGTFDTHAQDLVNSFIGVSPWSTYFSAVNVYRINVESNQQGADRTSTSTSPLVDTYFNSSFWVSGIERLLAMDAIGTSRAVTAANNFVGAGVWDFIFVLVNSTKYGGSGGSYAVSSVHPLANEVVLHEFGHTFADLADEYESAYPGFPPGDFEPNVDYNFSGPGLKWSIWVDVGTPLPTPETVAYANVVGAFEGARYLTTGIYRPWYECMMRSLGVGFCPVCKEAHVLALADRISLLDGSFPTVGTSVGVPIIGRSFAVTPWPPAGITYEWRLGGTLLSGETNPTLNLTAAQITPPSQTLEVKMIHTTSLVRAEVISSSFSWLVSPLPNAVRDWTIYQ